MNRYRNSIVSLLFTFISQALYTPLAAQTPAGALPFIMDMVHNNPGEAPYTTKYNDPAYMASQGFNGMVTQWFVNCAITYDNYEKNIVPAKSIERQWIEQKAT